MDLTLLNNDNTVLTLLDVCGSCITDVMYNFLYDRAIAMHEKTGMGLSEAYRQAVAEYIQESNTPKFYSVLLNTLHHYVRMSTVFNTLSYPDYISLYAGMFVPQMYAKSLTNEQKLNILSMVLGETVREFADRINKEYIRCIIDDHQDTTNVEVLQDCVLKIMLAQRNVNYDRFIESQQDAQTDASKEAPPRKTVMRKAASVQLTKLTDAFKRSIAKKNAVEKKNATLLKKNKQLIAQFNELKAMLLSQIAVQKEQAGVIDELKKRLASTVVPARSVSPPVEVSTAESPSVETYGENQELTLDSVFDVQYLDN